MKAKKQQKLSLEDYLAFLHSNKQTNLTSDFHNQVIFMHGFKKIHCQSKKVLTEVVKAIELVDPARSTLEDRGVSPCAALELEEIVGDLTDLNWQECCITSIQTVKCTKSCNASSPAATASASASLSYNKFTAVSSSFSISRKRANELGELGCKKKREGNVGGGDGTDGEASECNFGSGSVPLDLPSLGYSC